MNNDGYRINGGIGFSIASPNLYISFDSAISNNIIDKREHGFTFEELERLKCHLDRVIMNKRFAVRVNCVVHESIIQSHVGFGSNTMIYLACVEALFILNGQEYTDDDILSISGRGGTSGIGINTYFRGGFVFDTGIVNQDRRGLAPSSEFVNKIIDKPLLVKELVLPHWDLGVCIPVIKRKTEDEEKTFFQKCCPIEKKSVEAILYEVVYGITSSLMENDFRVFCKSIDAIQCTKWKFLERDTYGEQLLAVEESIREAGAECVGMSSLGPLLYFFGKDIDVIVNRVKQDMPQCVCFKTAFNNKGRLVEND